MKKTMAIVFKWTLLPCLWNKLDNVGAQKEKASFILLKLFNNLWFILMHGQADTKNHEQTISKWIKF